MRSTARFPASLGISALLHLALLLSLAALNILPAQKVLNPLEVNYLKLRPRAVIFDASADQKRRESLEKRIGREITRRDFQKIAPGQRIILSDKNEVPEPVTLFQKPAVTRSEFLNPKSIKLSFGLSEDEGQADSLSKLHKSPAYLTYNNTIRYSIWRSLTNKFFNLGKSYELKDKGLVYLKFSLNSDGSLKEYQVIDEKSRASDELKQIAVDGLLDASPFKGAPKELASPVLTFSLVIHFIREEDE